MDLAGRLIGPGAPVFVIAEAGVNHDGSLERAKDLIDAAARIGADAIKFQTFRVADLVREDAPLAEYQKRSEGVSSQAEMLRRLELGASDFAALAAHAAAREVVFLSTPFDELSAGVLDEIGVPAFKVGSGELTNLPFLVNLAARGRPLIVSTGMATMDEVADAVQAVGGTPLALLHCVSSYPAPAAEAQLRALDVLVEAFGVPVGWSHHCLEDDVAIAAVARGACIVEAHLTLDRTLPGPDHAMSIEPDDLGALISRIRLVESALGDGVKRPQPSELNTASVARRSLVAVRNLAAGTPVTAEAFTAKRPGGGISPARLFELSGRTLSRPLSADEPLSEADLSPAATAADVRRVAVLTGGRADHGLLRPTIHALRDDPRFQPLVVAAAMHLDPAYGDTLSVVEADAVPIVGRVATPGDLAARLAAGVRGIAASLRAAKPDVVLILGDRHEALACALAATSLELPIAHLHGGELSEGSLDDAMRHCITKLSHLHFPATKTYGERIVQLGEDPARVHVVGAAGLEAIRALRPLSRDELALSLGVELRRPLLAVTFHPASLRSADARAESEELAAALEAVDGSVIVTLPNDDPGGLAVRAAMLALEERAPHVRTYAALGQRRYLSLLAHADAVVGNSSSAIIEAPSFKLPVVDVGDRQRGRTRAANIRNVPPERDAIAAAIAAALEPAFRASLADMESPYGDGRVSERVLAVLAEAPLGELRAKRFFDLPDGPWRDLL